MNKNSEKEILVLTLNLHTYQETNQLDKLNIIADFIANNDIDFVAFQECAQNKSANVVSDILKTDNMALLICQRIKNEHNKDYNFVWNWSHHGWEVWEEGVAIMSKHKILETDNKYISTKNNIYDIESRKIIFASFKILDNKIINIFSTHTNWRNTEVDDEQNNQIENIKIMVSQKEVSETNNIISIVCGDFNCNPTSNYPWSEGYNQMIKDNKFKDSFLEANKEANLKSCFNIYKTMNDNYTGRIDYIFVKNTNNYLITNSEIVFKTTKVSDHFGVLTKIVLL